MIVFLGLFASGSAGCLLFSDPINHAPTVSIKCPDGTLVAPGEVACPSDGIPKLVRKEYDFEAVASDPDQSADSLQYAWYLLDKTCTTVTDQAANLSKFTYSITTLDPGCLKVEVKDSQGATATAVQAYEVVNRAPTANIAVTAGGLVAAPGAGQPLALPLFAKATLSGKSPSGKSSVDPDEDPLDFHWSVYAGDTSIAMPGCPDATKSPYLCTFVTQVPGTYRVQLVVSDDSAESPPAVQVIQVAADQLPNIVLGTVQPAPPLPPDDSPLQLLASADHTFIVNQVEDDGDPFPSADPAAPYPKAPAGFLWFVLRPGDASFQRLVNASGASLTIKGDPSKSPQRIRLRVEYRDRVTACQPSTPTCNAVFDSCNPAAPICYSSDLRAQWVTWTVDFR